MWGTTYGGFRPHPVVDAMDTWSQPCVPKVCTAIVCMEKQYWEIIYVLVHYIPVTPAGKQFICPIPLGSPISANLSFSHHVPETWKLLICTSESFILPILLHWMCLMPLVSVPLTELSFIPRKAQASSLLQARYWWQRQHFCLASHGDSLLFLIFPIALWYRAQSVLFLCFLLLHFQLQVHVGIFCLRAVL